MERSILGAVALKVNSSITVDGGDSDALWQGRFSVQLNRRNGDGNALDWADEGLLSQFDGAVLHHEFGFCDWIGPGEIADQGDAKDGSISGVNRNFAMIRRHLLEETTGNTAEFDLVKASDVIVESFQKWILE